MELNKKLDSVEKDKNILLKGYLLVRIDRSQSCEFDCENHPGDCIQCILDMVQEEIGLEIQSFVSESAKKSDLLNGGVVKRERASYN